MYQQKDSKNRLLLHKPRNFDGWKIKCFHLARKTCNVCQTLIDSRSCYSLETNSDSCLCMFLSTRYLSQQADHTIPCGSFSLVCYYVTLARKFLKKFEFDGGDLSKQVKNALPPQFSLFKH